MEYIQIQFSEKMRMLTKNFIPSFLSIIHLYSMEKWQILFFLEIVVLNENILFYIFKYIRVE